MISPAPYNSKAEWATKESKKRFHAQIILNLFRMIHPLQPGETILELGCGDGVIVEALREEGLDIRGCDFLESLKQPLIQEYLRTIGTEPYRLPFPDQFFDIVYSWQVFEHVMDLTKIFEENRRILKPGGIGLHIFTGRCSFLEPHTLMPLATMIRARLWLLLWASLGIRNEYQTRKSTREVVQMDFDFLVNHTNYPRRSTILHHARTAFSTAEFREDLFIDLGTSRRSKIVQRIAGMSPLLRRLIGRVYLVRKFQTRLLVLR